MRNYIYSIVAASCLIFAGCSRQASIERTSQAFNSLPPAVQKAVRSCAPDAEIASVDKKTRNDMNYYVIEFKEPGKNPKLTVAENGALLTSEQEKAMGGADRSYDKETGRDSKLNQPESDIGAPKGTTPKAASTDLSALPIPVQKTLKSKAPNATIKGITRHDEEGRTVYEFEFEDQGKNPTMRISEDGTVVQTLKK